MLKPDHVILGKRSHDEHHIVIDATIKGEIMFNPETGAVDFLVDGSREWQGWLSEIDEPLATMIRQGAHR